MKDLISVIIPTHNRRLLLRKSIESVLSQDVHLPLELIVVDDASDDGTAEMIKEDYPGRVRYFRHEHPCGGSAARNTGIKYAQGRYIAFLDDDDTFKPGKLKLQIEKFLEKPDIGLVYTGYRYINENGETIKTFIPEKKGYVFNDLLFENCIKTTSTVLIRAECFKECGLFDENLPSAQDWDMWLRISNRFKVSFVRHHLVDYLVHDNKITRNYSNKIEGHKRILSKYFNYICKSRSILSEHHFHIGYYLCKNGDIKTGRKWLSKSLKYCPYNCSAIKYLLITSFGQIVYEKTLLIHRFISR